MLALELNLTNEKFLEDIAKGKKLVLIKNEISSTKSIKKFEQPSLSKNLKLIYKKCPYEFMLFLFMDISYCLLNYSIILNSDLLELENKRGGCYIYIF